MAGEVTHHTAAVNGIKLHWVAAGSGPPVFLLHDFPEFWYAWRHQIPAPAGRYTVIAPDLRGYGHSGKPPDGHDKRTMATGSRDLAALPGCRRIAVVGHDRGARVGLRLTRDHPTLVARLAVPDCAHLPHEERPGAVNRELLDFLRDWAG